MATKKGAFFLPRVIILVDDKNFPRLRTNMLQYLKIPALSFEIAAKQRSANINPSKRRNFDASKATKKAVKAEKPKKRQK